MSHSGRLKRNEPAPEGAALDFDNGPETYLSMCICPICQTGWPFFGLQKPHAYASIAAPFTLRSLAARALAVRSVWRNFFRQEFMRRKPADPFAFLPFLRTASPAIGFRRIVRLLSFHLRDTYHSSRDALSVSMKFYNKYTYSATSCSR